jgi:hypothetical protein
MDQADGRGNVKSRPPVSHPVKIVYPSDPGIEQAVAKGTVARGDDKAWTEFIHDRLAAQPTGKPPTRPKR